MFTFLVTLCNECNRFLFFASPIYSPMHPNPTQPYWSQPFILAKRIPLSIHRMLLGLLLFGLLANASANQWNFDVFLDDKLIGLHRFSVNNEGSEKEVKIEADFDVKILFISVYRYQHNVKEHWRGNCLENLSAQTDDNGEKTTVKAQLIGGRVTVQTLKNKIDIPACVMSFAYWNPELIHQTRLLNPQTGVYENTQFTFLGEETLSIKGINTTTKHYRLTGPKNPLDLWYNMENQWVALESRVSNGKKLYYKLK